MYVIKNRQLEESDDADEYDYELPSAARLYGSHTNRIPIQSAVQAPRLFYGARFLNQALSLEKGEAPLVQNLNPEDKEGRSFDELQGESLGAVRALKGGKVTSVDSDRIRVAYDDGEETDVDLYDNFVYNQKSGITSRPLVQPGATFTPGQMLAASNYTDDEGTAAAGVNARIGLVPWRGFSMDDALPVSESFAKRLTAIQYQTYKQEADPQMRTDLAHYKSLFPDKLPKEMSDKFDDDGKVKAGTILQPGDPIILGTMPRTVRSDGANVGRLSKALQQSRRDASVKWDGNGPAEVVRSMQTKNGIKVAIRYVKPGDIGDKVVLRAGAKGTISKIIPDDRMPRTEDGQPLDVLLNPLSLLSRANPSTIYEMRLGNIARKLGKPLKVPSYLPKGQNWRDYVRQLEQEHGVKDAERIFDPDSNRFLTNPVTVGVGYIQRLHHTAEGKGSARGVASYDGNEQPAKGPGDNAQAKRFSGLENESVLSSGAYALMRENSTIRGQKSDSYWRALRAGKPLPKANEPFVWNKFRALLAGSGLNTKEHKKGVYRLAPFTTRDLDDKDPIDIDNGSIVNLDTLSPINGGLFDPRIVTGNRWGRIRLPRPVLNPAMEDSTRVMLGLTKQELQDIMTGRAELPERLR